jgi:hypothetical protein
MENCGVGNLVAKKICIERSVCALAISNLVPLFLGLKSGEMADQHQFILCYNYDNITSSQCCRIAALVAEESRMCA